MNYNYLYILLCTSWMQKSQTQDAWSTAFYMVGPQDGPCLMGPQDGPCLMSLFWCLDFLGACNLGENCAPLIYIVVA